MDKDKNTIVTDEMLSAFLDRELPDADMAMIKEALLTDKVLEARLSRLRRANDAVRETYEDISRDPVPQNLIDLVRDHVSDDTETQAKPGNARTARNDDKVVAFPGPQFTGTDKFWPSAIAASIALIVGISIGTLQPFSEPGTNSHGVQIAGELPKHNAISVALETAPSSELVSLSGGGEIEPILTFQSVDGEYCREAALHKEAESVVFVACRGTDSWAIELAVKTPPMHSGQNTFRPASAEAQSTIDVFLNKRMAGDAFGAQQEAVLIDKNWED